MIKPVVLSLKLDYEKLWANNLPPFLWLQTWLSREETSFNYMRDQNESN